MMSPQLEQGRMGALEGVSTMKLYRFVFDMVGGAVYGGDFTCRALNKTHAWEQLERRLPGAHASVKRLVCNSFQASTSASALH